MGAVLGGIFALIAWLFNRNKRVKLEQKNNKPSADKVTEGPFREKISESLQPVLDRKAVDWQPLARKLSTDLDLTEADLENETKTCSACKKTIKLFAKKCRYCGVLFEQNEIERAIKSKNIEFIERNLEISLDDEFKRCPTCAESINVKSMECEFCGEVFDPSKVELQAIQLILEKSNKKSELYLKICPKCGHHDVYRDYTGSLWCSHCKEYVLPQLTRG